jgi:catechol 2,3-dioxygenase-like lactoylglutathione lyase family enzyme
MRMLELHIEVADLDTAFAFYSRLIPYARVVDFPDGSAKVLVLEDGTAFGLWQKGKQGLYGGRAARHLHFALQISPEEYDSYLARLLEMGIEVIEHEWDDGHRSLYFFDADGHQGELMTKDWLDRPGSVASDDVPERGR